MRVICAIELFSIGKMFNYHFMALEYLAEELGMKVPLFESKLYGKETMKEFIIFPMDFKR